MGYGRLNLNPLQKSKIAQPAINNDKNERLRIRELNEAQNAKIHSEVEKYHFISLRRIVENDEQVSHNK